VIITRSPLRITLGGGSTDVPSYYREHGGLAISAAIDKYVYVSVTRPFQPGIWLKYSKLEHVGSVDEIQHPIIREAMRLLNVTAPQVEITTVADVPAGSGLGSSGSFTTALLKALTTYHYRTIQTEALAEMACSIEIDRLKDPVGKRDPYAAAFGGLTCLEIARDGRVDARPLAVSRETLFDLEDNLLLFFTGFSRRASTILEDQTRRTLDADKTMIENLHVAKELGERGRRALEGGDTRAFAEILNEHWEHKRRRSPGMSNEQIDGWLALARRNGAIGGNLVGAGGGGFLMLYSEDHRCLRQAMTGAGLQELRFRFDYDGTKVMFS
jgi:D-glycero-alpha-D-manno-heptose-7-phosphate kinase